MKRRKTVRGLAAALALAALLLAAPAVRAASPEPTFCNLVIVARFADDTADAFNLQYDTGWSHVSNWTELRKMFGTDTGDHSVKAFISAVSEGRVVLNNYFPQDRGDGTAAVFTLAHDKTQYDYAGAGYAMVREVIDAIRSGAIALDAGVKLDYREPGWVDNLTLIVQGDSEEDRASPLYPHHTTYEGTDTLPGGCRVGNYNVLDSASLIPTVYTASEGLRGRQSTISHELLHTLGFPDLYRYSTSDLGDPVGLWDIMAHTTYQWQTYPLAYTRQQAGFLSALPVTAAAGTCRVDPVATAGGTCGCILKSPLSDTEFFVAEYRVKGNSYAGEFDSKIPSGGLLLYRVDTRYSSNKTGNNYIYVFRQNPTSVGGAAEDRTTAQYAVLQPDAAAGLTEYGSTDLAADYTQNTLYFADGSNSGIRVSNLRLDGEQLVFDVTMADYSAADVWQTAGGALADADGSEPSLLRAGTELYVAAEKTLTEGFATVVQHSSGSGWAQLGQTLSGLTSARLGLSPDGGVLLTGCQDDRQVMYRYNGQTGGWELLWQDTGSVSSGAACIASDGSAAYVCYIGLNDTAESVKLLDALTGAPVLAPLSGGLFSAPKLCSYGGAWYLMTADISGALTGTSQPAVFRYADGTWQAQDSFGGAQANLCDLCVSGGRLYALASGNGNEPVLAAFDGTNWTRESLSAAGSSLAALRLLPTGGKPVAVCADSSGTASAWRYDGAAWTRVGNAIAASCYALDAAIADDTVYAAVSVTGDAGDQLLIRQLALPRDPEPQTPEPEQPAENFTLTLTPPAGYTDARIYVDGTEYAARADGGSYSVTLPDGGAVTAIQYRYNAAGVPVGMGVWLLRYAGGAYSAVWQPELEDLLTYHGFSVRVTGQSGIRFKTGIARTTKAQLIAGTLAGWSLAEYGTMVMRDARRGETPFVLGGTGVKSGRAYWTEGGAVRDLVFETAAGRDRFTSVLIGLPAAEYKTDFAFRGYIILVRDGVRYTLYGPVVARSIYTVAGQLLDRGEFAAGTPADQFLRKLRTDADAVTA